MDSWRIDKTLWATGLAVRVLAGTLAVVFLSLLLGSAMVSAGETPKQNVEFRWKFLKVGAMDFEIGPAFFSKAAVNAGEFGQPLFVTATQAELFESNAKSSDQGQKIAPTVHLAVTGVTNGPLRWFKNYHARAELKVAPRARAFTLKGEDGGIYEERELIFASGLPPRVESFVDSTALAPLDVQSAWKSDTVDPLTVFEWMIFSAVKGQSCAKNFWIYDGKRRYAARTADLVDNIVTDVMEKTVLSAGLNPVKEFVVSCRLTLIGSNNLEKTRIDAKNVSALQLESRAESSPTGDSLRQGEPVSFDALAAKPIKSWSSLWPFGKSDRNIDFTFKVCASRRVIVDRVGMEAPIGRVVGASKEKC